jgi:hypothetical protein
MIRIFEKSAKASNKVLLVTEKSILKKNTYRAERFLVSHQIYDKCSRRDKEYFHERVVQTDEIHEEVEVADTKNNQVQLLSLA